MVIESCGNGSPHVSNCYRYKPYGAPSRNRTGTPAINEAADFKSAVSTNFTIGASAHAEQAVIFSAVALAGILHGHVA